MLGTLFFDESRVNTAFRIRRTEQQAQQDPQLAPLSAFTKPDVESTQAEGSCVAPSCLFGCRGEVALPSLRASLLWWLDAEACVVQLLVVNDGESSAAARACQSRLLSVELPTQSAADLLTCGVTRNYMGDNGVAVVWVLRNGGAMAAASTSALRQEPQHQQQGEESFNSNSNSACLSAGFAQVTVQREVDNTGYSSLLLVPDEQMVACEPLTRIPASAFRPSDAIHTSSGNGKGSACVVAELPGAVTARTTSLVILTDGARVWRVELYHDGTVSVKEMQDDFRRNALRGFCDGNEAVRLLDTRAVAADLQRLSTPAAQADGSQLEASSASAEDADTTTNRLHRSNSSSSSPRWLRRFFGGSGGVEGGASRDDAASSLADLGVPATIRRRLYAAVSAVQQSPFVALTRWNGQVEVYEVGTATLTLAPQYPIGILPHALLRPLAGSDASERRKGKAASAQPQKTDGDHRLCALPAGATVQWATRHPQTQQVHIVTCLADSSEGRHPYLWTALPPLPPTTNLDGARQGQGGEILAQYCTVSVSPPTLSSTPLACAVIESEESSAQSRLVLISDVGAEEDNHLLCTRSLGALALRGEQASRLGGAATVVQVVDADGDGGFHGLLRTSHLHGYLCEGVQLQSVLSCGAAVVMVAKGVQPCRLFTMEDATADALMQMTEGVVVGVDEEDAYDLRADSFGDELVYSTPYAGSGVEPQTRVHYVPLLDAAPPAPHAATDEAFAVYWEGVNVIQSCAHGARYMTELLRDVLLATSPVTAIASLPRFLSEAHLNGYTASLRRHVPATAASVLAAVRLALSPTAPVTAHHDTRQSAARSAFYEYSRLYVTQGAMGKLLARLTFLTTTYLGWQSTQSVAFFEPTLWSSPSSSAAAAAPSADWVTQQIVTALEVLVAAYHAVPLAGADIIRVALVEDDKVQPTSASLVAALLPTMRSSTDLSAGLHPSSHGDTAASAAAVDGTAVVQVVNRLRRCGTPRTARACTAWVQRLAHRFPLLQHYQLLSLVETGAAPAQSARVQACCERVCQALARETAASVIDLLFLEGFFLMDIAVAGCGSAFRALTLDEVAAFIAAEPAMGPKLYAVGVLRRVTGLGAMYTSLSPTVARRYLYAMLSACDEAAERLQRRATTAGSAAPAPPYQQLRRAFAELQMDALLAAAQARVAQADMAGCFHDVQTAFDLMKHHRCLATYTDVVQLILSTAVEVACASQANMRALLRVTKLRAAELEDTLVVKWYNYIARLPTKSASEATEALRYRAIMGLHRFLMSRHSYAQCARLMSSLATLIRCSPQRRSASSGISVSELAGLALHAASLISSSVPMPENGRSTEGSTAAAAAAVAETVGVSGDASRAAAAHAATSLQASPTAGMAGSPLSLGYSWQPSSLSASPVPVDPTGGAAPTDGTESAATSAGHTRWLTRADIPWLQRRLYQAQCERQLWRRGCTLDCTDLWVEGAPAAAYRVSVEKLVCALMQTRLWPQAFRFACLSDAFDPCTVLEEWAVDLLKASQRVRSGDAHVEAPVVAAHESDRASAWEELISYCSELSTLENQFSAFVRTVSTALTYAYEEVPAELLAAHRMTDAYTAMSTLFHVALLLRQRAERAAAGMLRDDEEGTREDEVRDGHRNGATPSLSSSAASSNESALSGEGGSEGNVGQKVSAATVAATRRNVWRAVCAAARIAVEMLQGQGSKPGVFARGGSASGFLNQHSSSSLPQHLDEDEEAAAGPRTTRSLMPSVTAASAVARATFSPFTAGVVDPLAVCATELMNAPAYRSELASVPGVQETISRFLNCINSPTA